ncbi:MAG: flagellar hook-basal body complex protein FliE [bacterium]|nr:flagellar hook-basal body complex protein FliE [bacterium]
MNFSTSIQSFNTEFNLNAISDYNKYLQGNASFEIETEPSEFGKALESASKSVPLKDKFDTSGAGYFMNKIENSFTAGLDSVNKAKIEADRLQEDLAMGGSTSIHDAMIAAEKAELSMQMAIQVRNRIINAYTELTQMAM